MLSLMKKSAQCRFRYIMLLAGMLVFPVKSSFAQADRNRIDLNGSWEIEESTDSLDIPDEYHHSVEVPGLVNQAEPSFPGVDDYTTSDLLFNLKNINELTTFVDSGGFTTQSRNYFWYKKTFSIPEKRQMAFINISKAQFGSAVWINNTRVGINYGCFTSKRYNITEYIDWGKENTVVIRIGAHPGALPREIPYGIDYEKYKWTPGIYDDVEVVLCNNPVVEYVQIAPDINSSSIIVQTKVKNYQNRLAFIPEYEIQEWKSRSTVNTVRGKAIELKKGEEVLILDTLLLPDPILWDTENPFLYELEVSTGGDNHSSRFGMREFRFETATRRAYLNNKIVFLRGSNIALHRFFEDPKCGTLPWDEKWVRKMLAELPRTMNWNSFRFCIGPVPDMWFDIADEEGILIQNEFPLWTLSGIRNDIPDYWSFNELRRQMKDWVTDSWNHPSLVIWDLMNETHSDKIYTSKLVDELAAMDLSNRPWESSFNPPTGPNDVVEYHPYLMNRGFYPFNKEKPFELAEFETLYPTPNSYSFLQTGQSMIVNEYGWMWMNRVGAPTLLTKRIYDAWLGEDSSADERYVFYAYVLAGHTEFLRAFRTFAGVYHFVYLTSSHPNAITSDNFIDVEKLQLEPHFVNDVGEAFKPVGVYLNFWQPKLKLNETKRFTIMIVNDEHESAEGTLSLSIENAEGEVFTQSGQDFVVSPLGQQSYYAETSLPDVPGVYLIKATAHYQNHTKSTVSRRKVILE